MKPAPADHAHPAHPRGAEPIRGRSIVVIDETVLADDDQAARIIEPLRALGPEMDTFGRMPSEVLVHLHMDPEARARARDVDDAAHPRRRGCAAAAQGRSRGPGVETPLMIVELRQLGGALGEPFEGGGVLVTPGGRVRAPCAAGCFRDPRVRVGGCGGRGAGRRADVAVDQRAQLPQLRRGSLRHARAGYPEDAWLRLATIRSAVDPDGVLIANHRIPRLYEHGEATG